jgi:hypothetical protein
VIELRADGAQPVVLLARALVRRDPQEGVLLADQVLDGRERAHRVRRLGLALEPLLERSRL